MEKDIMLGKATELLEKCEVLTLASITEDGYPRICAMAKVKTDGIKTIRMATGSHSAKTGHFQKNPKASVCYYSGCNSVTLLGNLTIIHDAAIRQELWQDWFIAHFPQGPADPEYCILQFEANQATCWIEQCFETHPV